MKKNAIIALTAMSISATGWAAQPKTGLWHLVNKDGGATLAYIAIDDAGLRVWDQEWARRKTEVRQTDPTLDLSIEDINNRIELKGELRGEQGSGTLVKPHPQFPLTLEWEARLVAPGSDWEPWSFLMEGDSAAVNIFESAVQARNHLGSAQAFERFWNAEVESKYYALLTRTLYADDLGIYQDAMRKSALSSLREAIRNHAAEWESAAQQLPGEFKEASDRIKQKYPQLDLSGRVVVVPSLGEFDYRYVRLKTTYSPHPDRSPTQSRHFLYFAGDWLAAHPLGEAQRRSLIEQSVVCLALGTQMAVPQGSLRAEIAQRGIAAMLTADISDSPNLDAVLFQPSDRSTEEVVADFAGFRKRLIKDFNERGQAVVRDFFLGESRASAYRFAFYFARDLHRKYSLQELVAQFPYDKLREDMVDFLKRMTEVPGLQSSPPSGSR